MLNYWWVTRPKRKLNSVPEVLATFADLSLNQQWDAQRSSHLAYEEALEAAGLKRVGTRRDQTGGGARTYKAWLISLGLIFTQEQTGQIKLTLAGDAIMNGDSPVKVLTNQILKYQFPSSFSLGRGVQVASRFKIRPFRFLLRLLLDERIQYLTEEEIAKIIVTEAETESEKCYEYIVSRLLDFRDRGDSVLETDFVLKYRSSKGEINLAHPYSHLYDLANTLVNWLEYTQLAARDEGKLRILPEKYEEVYNILSKRVPFIDCPEKHEYFQRKFGVDPNHRKDDRNLLNTKTVTAQTIAVQKIRNTYISLSLTKPITSINSQVIDYVSEHSGIDEKLVEETLVKLFPHGSVGGFMTKYFEMAFNGREDATDFELATRDLFESVFGFEAEHVGPIGLTPDVLLYSSSLKYQAIIDNKAYSQYSVTNDHHNRMVYNYLKNISNYSPYDSPIAFFTYIAGGFGKNINSQIRAIVEETGVHGSAISVSNIIKMVEKNESQYLSHDYMKNIFALDRQIILADI